MSTEVADRFRTEVEVPDLPPSPGGRQIYWDDTIMEMVVELRRRLRSSNDDRSTAALMALVELEKTRMRHGQKLSGTHVPVLASMTDEWGHMRESPTSAKVNTTPEEVAPSPSPVTEPTQNSANPPRWMICEFHDSDDDWKAEVRENPEQNDSQETDDNSETKTAPPPQPISISTVETPSVPVLSGTARQTPPHPHRISP